MREHIADIEQIIGYEFKDKTLLEQAFFPVEHGRLHTFGQDVTRLNYAALLYKSLPHHAEGALDHVGRRLIEKHRLGHILVERGLDKYIVGKMRPDDSRKSATLLAIMGAVYLDHPEHQRQQGLKAANEVLTALAPPRDLAQLARRSHREILGSLRDQSHSALRYEIITGGRELDWTATVIIDYKGKEIYRNPQPAHGKNRKTVINSAIREAVDALEAMPEFNDKIQSLRTMPPVDPKGIPRL